MYQKGIVSGTLRSQGVPGGSGSELKPSRGIRVVSQMSVGGGANTGAARAMAIKARMMANPAIETGVVSSPLRTR